MNSERSTAPEVRLRPDFFAMTVVAASRLTSDAATALSALGDPAAEAPVRIRWLDDPSRGAIDLAPVAASIVRQCATPQRISNLPCDAENGHEYDEVAKLVLDGILELQPGGERLSGPASVPMIVADPNNRLRISEPSRSAIEHASSLRLPAGELAARLYRYGTKPVSPRWLRRFPDPDSIATHLRFVALTHQPAFRENGWTVWNTEAQGEWFACARTEIWSRSNAGRRLHKLYIAVTPSAVADALDAAMTGILCSEAVAFKIAATPRGLLRPDKAVVYCATRDALQRTTAAVSPAVSNAASQPVAFAERSDADPVLWWSSDPAPQGAEVPQASGRYDVCARVAFSIHCASRASPSDVSPVDFAALRLVLDGWDPQTFSNTEWVRA